MTILALDFSSSQRRVGIVQGEAAGRVLWETEVVEVGRRTTRAFGMVEQALADAHLEREAIEVIVVGLGPGSYTGIRASIALAQGWQLAKQVRVLGIPSVEALAAEAHQAGLRGNVHLVVDAQRREFYHANWRLDEKASCEVQSLEIVSRDRIESLLAGPDPVRGPDLKKAFPEVVELYPSARALGRLALGRTDFIRGEELRPVYLRETTFVKAAPPRL